MLIIRGKFQKQFRLDIFTLFRSEQPHFQALTPATSNIILLTSVQSSGRPLWPSLSFIWQVWHIKRMAYLKRVIRQPLLGHSKYETRDFLLFSSSIFLRPPKIACLVSCVSLILPPSPVHKRPHFVSLSSDASILDAIPSTPAPTQTKSCSGWDAMISCSK